MTFELRHEAVREQRPLTEPEFARWRSPNSRVQATFHRLPEGFLIRFLDRADFLIALDAGVVTCRPAPGNKRDTHDIFLNQIMPMIRGHQGELVIHASGVAIGGKVAAFVAPTGWGKSTLAATFARAGYPFLSDDGLTLTADDGSYLAAPNRPSLRLWQDSENVVLLGGEIPEEYPDDKSRVAASETLPFQDEPLPLAALYFLGPGQSAEPRISELSLGEAVAELLNHSFFLDAEDRGRMKRHFESLTRLVESVPSYTLDYQRDFDQLPDLIAAVSRHIEDGGAAREAD